MSSISGKKRPRSEQDAMELKAENDKTIATMEACLDDLESSSDPSQTKGLVTQASCTLLHLKSMQRDVMEMLKEGSSALAEKRAELEKQSMLLSSLEYEESFLQGQIAAEVSTPHLERMCREETQQTDESLSKDEMMNTFLCGSKTVSYQDAANYQKVLTKLHQEINLRGSLERDATQAQKSLTQKTKALEQNQQFLKELPKKLTQMEKASMPLQKFFASKPSGEKNVSLIGTERSKRLELARSLPGPLYTLFVQLQSYLDASSEEGVSVQVTKKTVKPSSKDAWFQADPHVVQLQMTVPETKNKQVTIDLVYLPKLNVVTAQASGCRDKVDLNSLLVNVFPGDDGQMTWSADSVHLKEAAATSMPGRPYHWCNYLAGIHRPTASSILDPISTKAVVTELVRRLDANATLTIILSALKRNKSNVIAVHPAWKDPSSPSSPPTTKLAGWTEEASTSDSDGCVKTFVATLKRKTSTVKATVTIDMSRYPSVPPKWSLTTGTESWGREHGSTEALESKTNPLYDNTLGQMESTVNSQLDELVNMSDKETYNWILAHQLYRLLRLCDEAQRSAGQVPRSIKGKDRAIAES